MTTALLYRSTCSALRTSAAASELNAAEKTLGFTCEELQSKPMFDFVHPDDRQRTLDQNLKVRTAAVRSIREPPSPQGRLVSGGW